MPGPVIDRRHFLGSAAASAAFFAMHDLPALAGQSGTATAPAPPRPRLLSLELLSGAPLSAMRAFYAMTLDLRIMDGTRRPFHGRGRRDPAHLCRLLGDRNRPRALLPLRVQHPREQDPEGARMAEGAHAPPADSRTQPCRRLSGRSRRLQPLERALDLLPRSRRQRRRVHRAARPEERRQRLRSAGRTSSTRARSGSSWTTSRRRRPRWRRSRP